MKILPVGAGLFHADRRTDRQTDWITYRNEANSRFSPVEGALGKPNACRNCVVQFEWHGLDGLEWFSTWTDGRWNRAETCSQNCDRRALPSSCLSVCLSGRNSSAAIGRIFIKFDIWVFKKICQANLSLQVVTGIQSITANYYSFNSILVHWQHVSAIISPSLGRYKDIHS
jgi:hypothetical protein